MENKKVIEKQTLADKILLQLSDCVDFGTSYKFEKMSGISGKLFRNLVKTNVKDFREGITELNKLKFINKKKSYDGSVVISLTDKGRLRALNIRFKKLNNKKESWDNHWRMVAFDIPEEYRKGRTALRYRLRLAGFYELQESLLLYPYDCEKEIKEFIKLFKLERYVRFALLDYIDNQEEMKRLFKLV